jgi:hypothetical protein
MAKKQKKSAELAEKELREKEQAYNALGRYIHDTRQKLVNLRERWDRGERSKELFQEISEVKLPEA